MGPDKTGGAAKHTGPASPSHAQQQSNTCTAALHMQEPGAPCCCRHQLQRQQPQESNLATLTQAICTLTGAAS